MPPSVEPLPLEATANLPLTSLTSASLVGALPLGAPGLGARRALNQDRADTPAQVQQLTSVLENATAGAQAQQLAFTLKNTEQQEAARGRPRRGTDAQTALTAHS